MSCNASAYSASHIAESSLACLAIKAVLMFLETILPETFAKRIVAVILLSVDTLFKEFSVYLIWENLRYTT